MAAYVLTDRAVIEALRDASARGVKLRVWRDAGEAARLSEFGVEAALDGRVQGLELRSSAPSIVGEGTGGGSGGGTKSGNLKGSAMVTFS